MTKKYSLSQLRGAFAAGKLAANQIDADPTSEVENGTGAVNRFTVGIAKWVLDNYEKYDEPYVLNSHRLYLRSQNDDEAVMSWIALAFMHGGQKRIEAIRGHLSAMVLNDPEGEEILHEFHERCVEWFDRKRALDRETGR